MTLCLVLVILVLVFLVFWVVWVGLLILRGFVVGCSLFWFYVGFVIVCIAVVFMLEILVACGRLFCDVDVMLEFYFLVIYLVCVGFCWFVFTCAGFVGL